jgi:peptidoglycan/LPS O-acetylase OafA/YrhL
LSSETDKIANLRPPISASSADRLNTLDGMRGLAAMAVVVHHYIARWAPPVYAETLYPHGNLQTYVPFTIYLGKFGILLFFLVSGFVIMMTLERSSGILAFWVRRMARLWPAMLFCATLSALIINTSGIAEYYGMGFWQVTWAEYFSSIFFFPPELTYRFLNLPGEAHWVEGAYWTLWHEVRFYVLISTAFWLCPRHYFLWGWLALQTLSTGLGILSEVNPALGYSFFWTRMLIQPHYLCWFSLGICGYMYWTNRISLPVVLIAIIASTAIVADKLIAIDINGVAPTDDVVNLSILYSSIGAFFVLFLRRSSVLRVLTLRPFMAIGLASYPLYLSHELPGMTWFMLGAQLGIPPWVGILTAPVVVTVVALLVHRFVEIPTKSLLTRLTRSRAKSTQQKFPFLQFDHA